VNRRPIFTSRIFLALVFVFRTRRSRSLSSSRSTPRKGTVWTASRLDWYRQLFNDSTIMSSLTTTLTVSILAAVLATIAGTFAAIGFYNMRRRGARADAGR
jgi:spermidine/putrescine transport system permease protein